MFEGKDIRDKHHITHKDISALNFIRDMETHVFRKHYRKGLRSHIMEMVYAEDIEKEKIGIVTDGIRLFPRAKPLKMLRIFVNRFSCLEEALMEAMKFKIIQTFLNDDILAVSNEFIVDYINSGRSEIVLCGLQEYVEGEVLDPWGTLDRQHLKEIFKYMHGDMEKGRLEILIGNAYKSADHLVGGVKKMIRDAKFIPDLAGVGNLIINPTGVIKLVDINNISVVSFETAVGVDDKGYPVCDKSIEALFLIETDLLKRPIDMEETPYNPFLNPERIRKVRAIESVFKSNHNVNG